MTLLTSLVRPILEYSAPVWSPQYGVHRDRIESVDKNCLIFSLRALKWNSSRVLASYSSRLLLINVPSLSNRRTLLGTMFIRNLIHGEVEIPELLSRLHLNVPNRFTRYYIPLVLNHCRSNNDMYEPF